jgi:hypothetical protein
MQTRKKHGDKPRTKPQKTQTRTSLNNSTQLIQPANHEYLPTREKGTKITPNPVTEYLPSEEIGTQILHHLSC